MKASLLEIQSAAFGLSQTYTNIVIFSGYAAFFAIWSFTREHMTQTQSYWAALLIGISVLTFIQFEVFRMIMTLMSFMEVRKLVVRELHPTAFIAERKRIAASSNMLVQRVVLPSG